MCQREELERAVHREKREADSEKIIIRRMTAEDVTAAAAIERACFSEPWSENAYRDTLANENAVYLIAGTAAGEIVGICGLLDILGEGDISNVAVAMPFRRRKIAERLLAELLRQGRARGIGAFTLEVRASNEAAIGLYRKFGFVTEGRRKNFYRAPREDALILWLRENDTDARKITPDLQRHVGEES